MTRAAHPDPRSTTLGWFKSSYSNDQGGACVEVAYDWRKSSYSSDQGGDCVEVAAHPAAVHIRDSKVADGPVLTVPPTAWDAFISSATVQ
ncbi:DUF397 domain-containing protein [Streptomyces sp. NBC_01433]|uniref:DUF397 domain-containing protein n=1 Tax=Streptomyces sp. NBC_01433 TaxID=2903864 RepID=UPI0022537588|nr:DUF397 domain-containing protein [Streptomyces sp. NBC_01433]MCX4674038.1 DUF397 domain-containing protein [Streptomyces sp. NBC_01433]